MATAQVPAPKDSAALTPPLGDIAGGLDLFLYALRRSGELARPAVRAALWRRIQHGALDLAWLAALLGALAAFLTLETIGFGLGLGVALGVRVVQTLVITQLAGFVCALLVVAGPGVAATFELGLMRHQGELRTLRLIGIDPRDYLIVPCVLGFALALFVLAFAFQLAAVLGGFALAALVSHASLSQLFGALAISMSPATLAISGIKNLVLGAVIGVVVCNQALVEPFSPTQMPRIARLLISRSLVALVIVYGGAALFLPTMIEIRGLEGVHFRLPAASIMAGEMATVVAPSEPCAREFVDLLLGLSAPRSGSVSLLGTELASLDERARLSVRRSLGYAAQSQGLVAHLALWENILLGAAYHGAGNAGRVDSRVRQMLDWCGWPEEDARRAFLRRPEHATPFERSGAAWIRAALGEPELLVCEDLFAGLALEDRRRLLEASVSFQSESPSRVSVFVLVNDHLLEEIQPTSVLYLSHGGDFRAET